MKAITSVKAKLPMAIVVDIGVGELELAGIVIVSVLLQTLVTPSNP